MTYVSKNITLIEALAPVRTKKDVTGLGHIKVFNVFKDSTKAVNNCSI